MPKTRRDFSAHFLALGSQRAEKRLGCGIPATIQLDEKVLISSPRARHLSAPYLGGRASRSDDVRSMLRTHNANGNEPVNSFGSARVGLRLNRTLSVM
jgi:hypothetical protein